MANKGKGAITIRVDNLERNSKAFREFVILEEFCHILDYKGDSAPRSVEFWRFRNEYVKTEEDDNFVRQVTEGLNKAFNHFNVNRLLMKKDFRKWVSFRKNHYGKQHRQKAESFYKDIISRFNQKRSLAILITEIVKMISFLEAVESFIDENKDLDRKRKEIIEKLMVSIKKTISNFEEYAEGMDSRAHDLSSQFLTDQFADKDLFFKNVSQLWAILDLTSH
jgi:hypothetical protein